MKKLPVVRWTILDASQERRLALWLREREFDLASREPEEEPHRAPSSGPRPTGPLDGLVTPFDPPPVMSGEIRLLSAWLMPEAGRPVYIAVLADWEKGLKLVAPFGPLAEPATPGELHTLRAEPPLAVLCLWNAHSLAEELIARSWIVSHMSEAEHADAWAVFQHAATGSPVPERLVGRVGPPILDADDPRLNYQAEEVALLAALADATFAAEGRRPENIVKLPSLAAAIETSHRSLAAATGATPEAREIFDISGRGLSIRIYLESDLSTATLLVHDAADEPATVLDGAAVINLAGRPLATIAGAFASFPFAAAADGIGVRLASGEALPLNRRSCVMKDECMESFVELFERARHAERLAFFSESQLAKLLRHQTLPATIVSLLTGEILLRQWLYIGDASEWVSTVFEQQVNPELRAAFDETKKQSEPRSNRNFEQAEDRAAWGYFVRRSRLFVDADGVIALLVGRNEAVALPFHLQPLLPHNARARALGGESIAEWNREICALEQECGEDLGFSVDAELPAQVEGGSFALAVVLARARVRGKVPAFHPLRVLATGAFRGGRLETVEGVQVKAALAVRMGAIFVAPAAGTIALDPGIKPDNVADILNRELMARGIGTLSPRQSLVAIKSLENEVHFGRTSLVDAASRLRRCMDAFELEPSSPFVAEAQVRACVLRAAIANHTGNPDRAREEIARARLLAKAGQKSRLYVEAIAHEVVTLTDLGFIDEAERLGRELLTYVKDEIDGDSEQLRCEMIASGALGGQSLLQAALRGRACGDESLKLLRHSLKLAEQLEEAREICRDAVQVVLWHALLKPESIEGEFLKAQEILARQSPADNSVSRAYLLRARFLGAYRRLLSQQTITTGFEKWLLPEPNNGHASWVRATALKYRGALHAAAGATKSASEDFAAATSLLSIESSPLLRLIGGTAALQASESLQRAGVAAAAHFLDKAAEIFREFRYHPEPALCGDAWEQRCDGLRRGVAPSALPNPQACFAY